MVLPRTMISSSKFLLALAALTFSLGVAACGGGDDDDDTVVVVDAAPLDPADAGTQTTPDASTGGGTNALGQLCSATLACPDGNTCTSLQGLGSTTMGYCSPTCTQAGSECATGYTGPAGGQPVCALSAGEGQPPSQCAIVCTAPTQCPTGLACTAVPGQTQPVSVCVPPA